MAEEPKKKTKLPTALKRRKQDENKSMINRMWKSRIHTAKLAITKAHSEEEKKGALSSFFSLIDKAAKRGIFAKNKVSRLKSRLAVK